MQLSMTDCETPQSSGCATPAAAPDGETPPGGLTVHNAGSGGSVSPRSHASSYPHTPPNSYTVESCVLPKLRSFSAIESSLDTQELFSKLDSELTKETAEEPEEANEQEDEQDYGSRADVIGRLQSTGAEEAFKKFTQETQEIIQSLQDDEADNSIAEETEKTSDPIPPPKSSGVNVEEYLFNLQNENVVASAIAGDLSEEAEEISSRYRLYLGDLPNSSDEYRKMISRFVQCRNFDNLSTTISLPNQSKFSTEGDWKVSMGSDDGRKTSSGQIVDFEVLRFMHSDIQYAEPILASERESEERTRYLKSVAPSNQRVRLIPSQSEQNISIFDEWQDDEIKDVAASDTTESMSLEQLRESLPEQKARLQAELGINLDDFDDPLTESAALDTSQQMEEFEWDDEELGLPKPRSHTVLPDQAQEIDMADSSINIQATRRWRITTVQGRDKRMDMKVLDPYKKVVSHGGYTSKGALILVFSACYMPDKSRPEYKYILDNLFLYVISAMQHMIFGDYVIVYFHGGADESVIPSLSWLKKCYQHIDHRIRKNLQALYLVHPDFWVKAGAKLSRVFASSKFDRKVRFVSSLEALRQFVSMDYIHVPDCVKLHDAHLSTEQRERALQGLL